MIAKKAMFTWFIYTFFGFQPLYKRPRTPSSAFQAFLDRAARGEDAYIDPPAAPKEDKKGKKKGKKKK